MSQPSKNSTSFFTRNSTVLLGNVISCGLWGSAAPCIKVGYSMFGVDTANVFSVWLFAGMRFTLAGLMVLLVVGLSDRRLPIPTRKELLPIVILGAFQTAIQYACYYIGVANSTGVKVSLYNGTGPFITLLVTCLIFGTEKLTLRKISGCIVGFSGIALVALDGGSGGVGGFTLIGEGMVIGAALASAFASSFSKSFTKKMDALLLCGYQFVFGGIVMMILGSLCGGQITRIAPSGCLLLTYMGLISSVAFGVRMILLKYNPVSKVTIYQFLTPIFGVFLSALILKEDAFRFRMIISLALVVAGIYLVNSVGAAGKTQKLT
ncbi:MAG: DMT family transporter [Eubacteriales bacterium]|nr:DMT family transporter [Eubacteriales bacterium]